MEPSTDHGIDLPEGWDSRAAQQVRKRYDIHRRRAYGSAGRYHQELSRVLERFDVPDEDLAAMLQDVFLDPEELIDLSRRPAVGKRAAVQLARAWSGCSHPYAEIRALADALARTHPRGAFAAVVSYHWWFTTLNHEVDAVNLERLAEALEHVDTLEMYELVTTMLEDNSGVRRDGPYGAANEYVLSCVEVAGQLAERR